MNTVECDMQIELPVEEWSCGSERRYRVRWNGRSSPEFSSKHDLRVWFAVHGKDFILTSSKES